MPLTKLDWFPLTSCNLRNTFLAIYSDRITRRKCSSSTPWSAKISQWLPSRTAHASKWNTMISERKDWNLWSVRKQIHNPSIKTPRHVSISSRKPLTTHNLKRKNSKVRDFKGWRSRKAAPVRTRRQNDHQQFPQKMHKRPAPNDTATSNRAIFEVAIIGVLLGNCCQPTICTKCNNRTRKKRSKRNKQFNFIRSVKVNSAFRKSFFFYTEKQLHKPARNQKKSQHFRGKFEFVKGNAVLTPNSSYPASYPLPPPPEQVPQFFNETIIWE